MSAVAKMHHTDFVVGGETTRLFRVPEQMANIVLHSLERYEIKINLPDIVDADEELIDAEEAFAGLYAETSRGATLLRGYRGRDNFTQAQLAEKLGTSQSSVASMEKGKRPVSIRMAKKLAKIFDANYQNFL
jgi:DNA-binding XRE family transcriptional regulator